MNYNTHILNNKVYNRAADGVMVEKEASNSSIINNRNIVNTLLVQTVMVM
jgi:hypothetical protein